ncbi:MAG: 3-deoxy-8-phosphooctulonate synthase [Candidatus Pelagibacterales bacterium]|jgi:2-dehydro-3-deoxyphosphooctonate aldolase (KDO 8-P synthase)
MNQNIVSLNNISISNDLPITLIAGPCVLESHSHAKMMVEMLLKITTDLKINFIYKTSYDKANRTSLTGIRGLGLDSSLKIFSELKAEYGINILTDVHNANQCDLIKDHVDILQIPAFLCRQTDLLIAAANTNKIINIKKGQFLSPHDMINVANKIIDSGNNNLLLTERGASFGYNNLVSDMRSLEIMKNEIRFPVIFDATHSVQAPGGLGGSSGGDRKFVPVLSRAAVAVGVAGVFMETHEDPDNAPSDGPNMVKIEDMTPLLKKLIEIDNIVKQS